MENLYTDEDIEYISNLIQCNYDNLLKIKEYKCLNKKLGELQQKIEELGGKHQELFDQYLNVNHKMYDYELCNIFYQGLKKGIAIDEKIK